ncbi:MAG: extracellular solute-binding protein [Lachnospiraceae bacterium]|nr:extracellular solute-binding protein [Lachnospiraceae bacterium]
MRQDLKAFLKKLCAGMTAACMMVSIIPGIPVTAEEGDTAMGRYLESDITIPESIYPLDVVRTKEGTLRIVGQDTEEGVTIWDSSDEGATWEKRGALPEEYAETYFLDIALNPEGGGAGITMEEASGEAAEASGEVDEAAEASGEAAEASGEAGEVAEASGEEEASSDESIVSTSIGSYEYSLVCFDTEGNAQRFPFPSELIGYIQFSQSGELLQYSFSGGVHVLDQDTGAIASTITESNVDTMGICGNEALLLTETELQRYDFTTGEPLIRDEALDDALYADGTNYMNVTSLGGPIVMTQDEEGRLYYATQKGIFSHVMEGSVVEQVVDGELSSLGDPSTYFMGFAVLNQSFYVLTVGGTAEAKLLKYEYNADVPSTPGQELTVYSLRENDSIRQAAVLFQKKYPDVYVNYKTGMSGTDGVTASDALRTLNTDILAGNGPDVLILDEMSVETYAKQGLLMDLSSVVAEIQDSEGLLENISEVYRSDELLPAVPSRFGMLMAVGDPELINTIDGFDSLAELAAQGDVMNPYDMFNIGEILYRSCAGSWKNEDNTINQEKLAEFVRGVKYVYDTYQENKSEKAAEEIEMYINGIYSSWDSMEEYGVPGDDLAMGIMDLATGACQVKLGSLNDIIDYSGLVSVNKLNGACHETLLSMQQSNVFRPFGVLGVLNTAKNTETACNFIKYMLSEEGQSQSQGRGFPVNVKAFEAKIYTDQFGEGGGFSVSSSDGGEDYVELSYVWPTKEESDALYEMAKQVNTCADIERVQHDVVMEEIDRCISGEISEDEAVNVILQKINLYLAE